MTPGHRLMGSSFYFRDEGNLSLPPDFCCNNLKLSDCSAVNPPPPNNKHIVSVRRFPTYILFSPSGRDTCARSDSAKLPSLLFHRYFQVCSLVRLAQLFLSCCCCRLIALLSAEQSDATVICALRPGNIWHPQGPKSIQPLDKLPAVFPFLLSAL